MTVGEALAEARTRAGLSVDEVSERTKIREVVIRAIERDDYDLCGGDLFVHGYLRVIADAVGLEAQPLIRSYDSSGQVEAVLVPAAPAVRPAAPASVPAEPESPKAPPPPPHAEPHPMPEAPRPTTPQIVPAGLAERPGSPGPAPEVMDLTRITDPDGSSSGAPGSAAGTMRGPAPAAGAETRMDLPAFSGASSWPPSRPASRPPSRPSSRPSSLPSLAQLAGAGWLAGRRRVAAVVAVVAAVLVIVVAFAFLGGGSGASTVASTTAGQGSPGLPVSFALAYGPNGIADGDNPGSASNPVTAGSAGPWSTAGYRTARFGGQKTGTGLLLDMGSPVTVTGVAVDLGSGPGASVELQTGNSTADLTTAGKAGQARGATVLRPGTPVRARYLLVWFTRLPRASGGQYQASVYRIAVNGHP